jgi:hypothetical protein
MIQRRIVTFLATATVIVFTAGCTGQKTAFASLTESDVSRSTSASALSGTWRGWFLQTGVDGHVEGDMTLEIKDDGTYRLISTRRGRGDAGGASNDSGIVVASGRTVTLKSSSGRSIALIRQGDTLYGVAKYSTGHPVKITVERTSRAPAVPATPVPPKDHESRGVPDPPSLDAP